MGVSAKGKITLVKKTKIKTDDSTVSISETILNNVVDHIVDWIKTDLYEVTQQFKNCECVLLCLNEHFYKRMCNRMPKVIHYALHLPENPRFFGVAVQVVPGQKQAYRLWLIELKKWRDM
jgi:hypothetical protein